jgi:transposase
MANVLPVQTQQAILALQAQGRSIRRIARELGIHRKTVRGYLDGALADPKCTTLSTSGSAPKCSTVSASGKSGRRSHCDPYAEWIGQRVERGLSAQRIFQDLRAELGFAGSYQAVKRFVRRFKATQPGRVWRIEVGPGEEAQVDFGVGAPVVDAGGRRRRSWVLRIVLSYSRRAYSEAVLRQDTESFIRCIENAFRHFGGVPHTLSLDNLKAAVLRFDWADPDLNPKFRDFARHYGVAVLPCKPRTPEHKGKVESGVGYVKKNALAARCFESIAAQNQALRHWEATVADLRIHGTTKRQVLQLFAQERPRLLPLPDSLFPCFREATRCVHRDGFVEIEKAYYEAAPEYVGADIWARWDAREVRLFNARMEPIGVHRRLEPGQFTRALGIGGGHGSIQSNLDYWLARAADLGPSCAIWAGELARRRGVESIRSLMGLARLLDKSSHRLLNLACAEASRRGAWRLRDVRALLGAPEAQGQFAFAQSHPLIRDLNEYGIFIKTHCPP